MRIFKLIAIKNHKGERKLIRETDYDKKKHELFKGPSEKGKNQREFGKFKAQETESKGWWEVIDTETNEVQNEKNLREDAAIELAKELGG